MAHVRKLAGDIGVRVRATSGERRGSRYIAAKFKKLGYSVRMQKFSVSNGTSQNVIATWPGAARHRFIVGGHMDSVPTSPGANDNASGVAVVLETARIFAGTRQARWIRFVAFGSEEFGDDGEHHVGSQVMVKRLGKRGRNGVAGMTSVDMVGDGSPLYIGHFGISEPVVARSLYRRVRKAGIETTWRVMCDCSDNGPFEHAGIPASYMWSGKEPDYHSSSDTVANMDPNDLARTGHGLRAFLRALDRRTIDHFRRTG
jgi:Zn-dependent M28 family amino/carboxypeptidase